MFIVDIEEKKKNINNNKEIKEELLLKKTIVTIELQEQKMNCCGS